MKSSGIVAAVLIVGVFVPLAWYQGRPAPVEPDVAEVRTQNIFTLAPGDCFEADPDSTLSDVVPVICEEVHTHELFALTRSIAENYDEAAVSAEANDFCIDMFHRYTGAALAGLHSGRRPSHSDKRILGVWYRPHRMCAP